jgi:hypothetical protein
MDSIFLLPGNKGKPVPKQSSKNQSASAAAAAGSKPSSLLKDMFKKVESVDSLDNAAEELKSSETLVFQGGGPADKQNLQNTNQEMHDEED